MVIVFLQSLKIRGKKQATLISGVYQTQQVMYSNVGFVNKKILLKVFESVVVET